jgi:hypothetical protein
MQPVLLFLRPFFLVFSAVRTLASAANRSRGFRDAVLSPGTVRDLVWIRAASSKLDRVITRTAAGIQHDGRAAELSAPCEFIEFPWSIFSHNPDRADPTPAIRYFLALASTLNFTRAAEQCNGRGAATRYAGKRVSIETLYLARRESVPVSPGDDDKSLREYLTRLLPSNAVPLRPSNHHLCRALRGRLARREAERMDRSVFAGGAKADASVK